MNNFEMPSRYDATLVETKWYDCWEKAGLFKPEADATKPTFSVSIPPPNITGALHMGHALCYPLQDTFGRFKRLTGYSVLILPGQDHAGIAAQSVVEKQLRKEGTSGATLGREKFIEKVWEWRNTSGDEILSQFRQMGCGFDWDRSRFTLDEKYAEAVLKVFIDWFERGLIFRGKRVVNWDPILQTSVSDLETERSIVKGELFYIRYPYADGSGEIVVATTRPETMLGDVAVAVHPSDFRYQGKVGQLLTLPLTDRTIPIIADVYPDPEFGSGAVKITPAHDPNDYLVGVRHNLPMPIVLDEKAKITALGGKYEGLDRKTARKQIVADLEAGGFLVEIKEHEIALVLSERSGEVIEPLLSEQWFVDQPALASRGIEAVKNGEIRFFPKRYEKIFVDWMENIHEWCVSRQLWWGHRVPIYYDAEGSPYAALNWEDAQNKAGIKEIVRQDDDVLDTWFSSGLWPFATLGWPEKTDDFKRFYPTQLMITDRNIINLWVARMIMMGFDQTGAKPFTDVMIHATVLNEKGQRMSKSLGTGVDPRQIIESIGSDALRWTLQSQTGENQDIKYSEARTGEARNFCNKIWNAVRFLLLNLKEEPEKPAQLELVDKWLLSRLAQTEKEVKANYEQFNLQGACQVLYRFFWGDICDWYIEIAKPRLQNPDTASTPQWVLLKAIESFLIMLHPIMPHLTEEVYSYLPIQNKALFVMQANWPNLSDLESDKDAESKVEHAFEVVRGLRALRTEVDLPAMKFAMIAHYEGDLTDVDWIVASQAWIQKLVKGKPEGDHVSTTVEGIDLHIPTEGLVNKTKEVERLSKEAEKIQIELNKLNMRLNNPQFVERAKPEVVAKEKLQAQELAEKLIKVEERKRSFET